MPAVNILVRNYSYVFEKKQTNEKMRIGADWLQIGIYKGVFLDTMCDNVSLNI